MKLTLTLKNTDNLFLPEILKVKSFSGWETVKFYPLLDSKLAIDLDGDLDWVLKTIKTILAWHVEIYNSPENSTHAS